MGKIINVVDKNNRVVASISNENVILHNDYKIVETNEDNHAYSYSDGTLELLKPEVTI